MGDGGVRCCQAYDDEEIITTTASIASSLYIDIA